MAKQKLPKEIEKALMQLKPVEEKVEIKIDEQNSETIVESKEAKEAEDNNHDLVVNYINDLTAKILQLEEANLQNIAKIQTMARRHFEEEKQIRKYGGSKLAEEILKPIDLFKKVLNSPISSEEVKNYLIGFNMIVTQLDQALEENGITIIPVKIGDKFDHNLHNANEAVESETFKANEIVEIISNGYKIYDRVIIHAIVKVAK